VTTLSDGLRIFCDFAFLEDSVTQKQCKVRPPRTVTATGLVQLVEYDLCGGRKRKSEVNQILTEHG